MNYRLFCFVKFFTEEKYAEDFMNGKLYCNTLRYFKELEQGEDGRGDPYEGLSSLIQPQGKVLKLVIRGELPEGVPKEITIKEEDLAGPILVHSDENLDHRVFCMYAIYIDDSFTEFSDEELDDDELQKRVASVNNKLRIPEEFFSMGKHAVLIYDIKSFMEAIESYEKANKHRIRKGLVRYYDDSTFDGDFEEHKAIFSKPLKFSHQKEYRLAFKPLNNSPFLEIGSMEAYAKKVTSAQVKEFAVEVRPNESAG